MPRDEVTTLDILRAAQQATAFVGGMSKDEFLNDAKTQAAVLHQLLVIGEAVKRLSEDYRSRRRQIPWKQIAGMRDVLIHAYDTVDLEEVWKTISADVPALMAFVESQLTDVE